MNNFQNRLSTYGSYLSTATMFLLAFCAIAHYGLLLQTTPIATVLEPRDVQLKLHRVGYNLKNKKNLGKITFDLDADLSSLFHYNTKMLFVSILAEFENKEYKFNQACIWDDVIMDVEDSIFKLRKKKAEYMIHDLADSLAGSTANLTLQYQIIPWVGMMVTDRIVFPHALTFPSKQKK